MNMLWLCQWRSIRSEYWRVTPGTTVSATFHHLHSAGRNLLYLPRHRLSTFGGWAFAIAGPTACNSLPEPARNPIVTEAVFRAFVKDVRGALSEFESLVMRYTNPFIEQSRTSIRDCILKPSAQRNDTEAKQFQNSFNIVSKLFCFSFSLLCWRHYCLLFAVVVATRQRSACAGHELVCSSSCEYVTYGSSLMVTTRSRHFWGRPRGGDRWSPGHEMSSIFSPSRGRHWPICAPPTTQCGECCALFHALTTISATEALLQLEHICGTVSHRLYEHRNSATEFKRLLKSFLLHYTPALGEVSMLDLERPLEIVLLTK